MTFLCLLGLILSTLLVGGGMLGVSAVYRKVDEARTMQFISLRGMSDAAVRRWLRLDLKFYKEIAWIVGGAIGIILSLLPCFVRLP